MPNKPAVYFMASQKGSPLYIGVTAELAKQVWKHKHDDADAFCKEHGLHALVYFELFGNMAEASARKKQLSRLNRTWLVELIEKNNPEWKDLWDEIAG